MSETRTVNPVRIFISGACAGLAQVRDSLAAHADIEFLGMAADTTKAAQKIRANGSQVILHAVAVSEELPVDEIEILREESAAPIVLLVNEMTPELLQGALRMGIADVVLLPQLTENLVFTIKKAHSLGAMQNQAARKTHESTTITVFSPKGGSGKTTIATNMAAAYAQRHRLKTLLVDIDLQFGDVAIMLGVEPQQTVLDLVMSQGELDADKLRGYVTRHPSGLDVLPSPLRPEDAELVSDERLGNLLDVARRSYDVVIIDTPTIFNSSVLTALDRTDALLVVASMEIPALKSTRVCLQTLDMLNFPRERAHVLMNRAHTKVGLRQGEVERVLERPVAFEVPSNRAVPVAINRGVPVSVAEPNADVSKAIHRVCSSFVGDGQAEAASKRRGLFGRRKKSRASEVPDGQMNLYESDVALAEAAAAAAAAPPPPAAVPDPAEVATPHDEPRRDEPAA